MSDQSSEGEPFDNLQRANVIKELFKTETDYVKDLQVLINTFMYPLEELGIISHNESKIVFSNLLDLLEINQDFLQMLEDRVSQSEWDLSCLCVGDLFRSLAKNLGAYKLYCTNQPAAIEFLNDMKNGSKEFNAFLTTCLENPVCRGLVFQSWLIKPLQRLCKYPLLLRELIKCTPEKWREYQDLKDAAVSIDVSVNFVNEEQKKSDQAEANEKSVLEAIQATLVEDKNHFVLIKTGRKVIKKTTMLSTPLEKKDKKAVEVTVYMFSDIFLVLSSYKGNKMRVDMNLHYKCMRVADVDYGGGDADFKCQFCIEVRDQEKNSCLLLYCKNANEKRDWLKDLKTKIKDYQIQRFVQSNSPLLTASAKSNRLVVGSSDLRVSAKKDSKLNVYAFPPSEKYQLSCLTSRTALLRRFAFQEEDYIGNLWIILEGFMNPLLEMYADEFEEELITIFSYISEIVDVHQDILLEPLIAILETLAEQEEQQPDDSQSLDAAFATHFSAFFSTEYFEHYELFFENFRDRHKLQKSLTESLSPKLAELSSLIKQIEQEPEPHASIIKGAKLYDLLDIPIKQMYKYVAFLSEFLRLTPDHHEDHQTFVKLVKEYLPKMVENMEKKISAHDVVIPGEIEFGAGKRGLRQSQDTSPVPLSGSGRQMHHQKSLRDSSSHVQSISPTSVSPSSHLAVLATDDGERSSGGGGDRYSARSNNKNSSLVQSCSPDSSTFDNNATLSTSPDQHSQSAIHLANSSSNKTLSGSSGPLRGSSSNGLPKKHVRLNDSQDLSARESLTSSAAVLNRQSSGGGLRVAVRPSRAMAMERSTWKNAGKQEHSHRQGASSGGSPLKRAAMLQKEQTYSAVVLGQEASTFAKLAQEIERKRREAYLKSIEKENPPTVVSNPSPTEATDAKSANTNTASSTQNAANPVINVSLRSPRSGANKPAIGTNGRSAKAPTTPEQQGALPLILTPPEEGDSTSNNNNPGTNPTSWSAAQIAPTSPRERNATPKASWFHSNPNNNTQPNPTNSNPSSARARPGFDSETTALTLGTDSANLVHYARDNPVVVVEAGKTVELAENSPATSNGGGKVVTPPSSPRKGRGTKDRGDKSENNKSSRRKPKTGDAETPEKSASRDKGRSKDRKQQRTVASEQQQNSNNNEEHATKEKKDVPSLSSLAQMLKGLDEDLLSGLTDESSDSSEGIENGSEKKKTTTSPTQSNSKRTNADAQYSNSKRTNNKSDKNNNVANENESSKIPEKSPAVANASKSELALDVEAESAFYALAQEQSALTMDATFNLATFDMSALSTIALDNLVGEIQQDVSFETNLVRTPVPIELPDDSALSTVNLIANLDRAGGNVKSYGVATTMRLEKEVDFGDEESKPQQQANFSIPDAIEIPSVAGNNQPPSLVRPSRKVMTPLEHDPTFDDSKGLEAYYSSGNGRTSALNSNGNLAPRRDSNRPSSRGKPSLELPRASSITTPVSVLEKEITFGLEKGEVSFGISADSETSFSLPAFQSDSDFQLPAQQATTASVSPRVNVLGASGKPKSGTLPKQQQQSNGPEPKPTNNNKTVPTFMQQQEPISTSAILASTAQSQPQACNNFQPQAFKKGHCMNCFLALAEHEKKGETELAPKSATEASSGACANFQPQTFKKLFCLNCFLHQNEHVSSTTSATTTTTSKQQPESTNGATANLKQQPKPQSGIALSSNAPSNASLANSQQGGEKNQQQGGNATQLAQSGPTKSVSSQRQNQPANGNNGAGSKSALGESSNASGLAVQEEVIRFLSALDLTRDYARQLQSNGVTDKKTLLLCTEDDLKSIGFNLGDRRKVLAATESQNENGSASSSTPSNGRPLTPMERDVTFTLGSGTSSLNASSSDVTQSSRAAMIQPRASRIPVFNSARISDMEKTVDFDDV